MVRRILAIVVLAAVVTVSACATSAPAPTSPPKTNVSPILLGVQAATTGPIQALGADFVAAVRLATEDINQKGGIKGRRIELVERDSKADPQAAVAVAQEFIGNKDIVAFVGGMTSIEALPIKPVVMQGKLPYLAVPANPTFTDAPNDWVFQANVNTNLEMQAVFAYLQKGLKSSKVAILYANDALGQGARDSLVAEAPKFGFEVVAKEQYGNQDTDMTPQLAKIKATDAAAILIWGLSPRPEIAVKNAKQLGMQQRLIASSATDPGAFRKAAGDAAIGTVFVGTYMIGNPDNEVGKHFMTRFKSTVGRDDNLTGAIGYSLPLIMEQALLKAIKSDGSVDRQSVRDALETVKTETPIGAIAFSKDKHYGLTPEAIRLIKIDKDTLSLEWSPQNR